MADRKKECKARLNFQKQIVCECTDKTEDVKPPVNVDEIERKIVMFSIRNCEMK